MTSLLKSTGDPDIDKKHALMVQMMQTIIEHTKTNSAESLKSELDSLYDLAKLHFEEEEVIMQQIKYPFMRTHFIAHEDILYKIKSFQEVLNHSNVDYSVLVKNLLRVVEKHVEYYDVSLFKYNEIFNQQASMVFNG